MTLEDLIDAPIYNLTMVLPAKVAAATMVVKSRMARLRSEQPKTKRRPRS
jgi:hypothetical protein